MKKTLEFEGHEYNTEHISENANKLFLQLQFVQKKIVELSDNSALLHKAKNSYINDLKGEVVSGKLGVEISDLLTD